MNLYRGYGQDLSLYDFGFSDPSAFGSLSQNYPILSHSSTFNYADKPSPPAPTKSANPTSHRHDGTSPLPLGMDWSPPPRVWEGRNSVWPHGSHTGWSFCSTIPSWTILPNSKGSDHAVFYRVQVGIQSPEGITTTRGTLRRYSDFLKLFSELTKAFPKKKIPPAPPKRLLRMREKTLLEERRCALEEWMEKLLTDISLSRSADVAIFLDLEAAARASFDDSDQALSDANSSVSNVVPASSSFASDYGTDLACKTSEIGTENNPGFRLETTMSDQDLGSTEISNLGSSDGGISNLGVASLHDDNNSLEPCEGPEEASLITDLESRSDIVVALPSQARNKMNRSLTTMERRLTTAKTDMEDLIARLNQEVAVRQYLTTKVKDLELDLETTKQSGKDNLEQAILIERDRFTQSQWDIEELRLKCSEMEISLKSEQDEKAQIEETKAALIKENEMLMRELDVAREQLENMKRTHEDSEMKSKCDIKRLVKEVKSLRSIQLELKDELSKLTKEKLETERILQKEKQIRENGDAANAKLLHECEILRNRLEECSVNFLVEEADKLVLDTSSPSEAIGSLNTSDNRTGLLLAEAQLLAQDVEKDIIATMSSSSDGGVNGTKRTTNDELRKLLTDMFIDNARLRKQVNSVIRSAIRTRANSDKDDDFDEDVEENVSQHILG